MPRRDKCDKRRTLLCRRKNCAQLETRANFNEAKKSIENLSSLHNLQAQDSILILIRRRRRRSSKLIGRMRETWLALIATLFLLLTAFAGSSSALSVAIKVPSFVRANDAFWLNCSHEHSPFAHQQHQQQQQQQHQQPQPQHQSRQQINKDEIYAIKWFKDNSEFYKFVPSLQKAFEYNTSGVNIDVSTNARALKLHGSSESEFAARNFGLKLFDSAKNEA